MGLEVGSLVIIDICHMLDTDHHVYICRLLISDLCIYIYLHIVWMGI